MRKMVAGALGVVLLASGAQARPAPRTRHAVTAAAQTATPPTGPAKPASPPASVARITMAQALAAPSSTMSWYDFFATKPSPPVMALVSDIKEEGMRNMTAMVIQLNPSLVTQANQIARAPKARTSLHLRDQVLADAGVLLAARNSPDAKIAAGPDIKISTPEELKKQVDDVAKQLADNDALMKKQAEIAEQQKANLAARAKDPTTPAAGATDPVLMLAAHGPAGMDPNAVVQAVAAHPEVMPQVQWLADHPNDPQVKTVRDQVFSTLK